MHRSAEAKLSWIEVQLAQAFFITAGCVRRRHAYK